MGYVSGMTRSRASREEWLLLYSRGLDVQDIARICHTLPTTAEAYIRDQLARDPSLFDTRLCRCLEPSLPVFRDEDASMWWEGNLLSLARFVEAQGRFPRRAADTTMVAGALEVFLYHWVRAQRGRSAVGELTARQERQLEGIPRWTVLGRDQLHTKHWDERLTACRVFVAERRHLPRYRRGTTDRERSLGTWLGRQRARHRRGLLPAARAAALDDLLSDAGAASPPSR